MRWLQRPRHHPVRLLAATAVIFALVGVGESNARSPIALGVNIADAPGLASPIEHYVDLVHRRPAIVMWYQQWSEPLFYSTQLPNVRAVGALPLITWDPSSNGNGIPLRQIVSGRYDSYIKSAADAAAAWKGPIYIRFAHEMNLGGSPFGPGHDGNTPSEFVRAWRHVVQIFRRQQAGNVEWVWSPNVNCDGTCPFKAFYPGNSWVDWVALDGYNYSSVDHRPWESFAQVFGSSYRELTRLSNKPVMVAETSSATRGGSKPHWITRSFVTIPHRYPRIRAVVWFDRVKETNWTVNSSPASLRAWKLVAASSTYAGSASTLLHVAPLASDVVVSPNATAARHQRKHRMAKRSAS